MDYNTSRKQLVLPEYGRNIQNMADNLKNIPDRDLRTKTAKALVTIMGNMIPQVREIGDYKQKLWDHLSLMSNFELDVDTPYRIIRKEEFYMRPNRIPYSTNRIRFRHYGKTIELMLEKVLNFENGPEKMALVQVIANHMKKSYVAWNGDSVSDTIIFHDIAELTGGLIRVSSNDFKLAEVKKVVEKPKKPAKKSSFKKRR